MNKKQPQPNNQIKLADNIVGAEYANIAQIMHNKEEFRLMFAHIFEPTGKVVSKITVTSSHFKRIVLAMQENLKRYEDQFGEIEKSEGPSSEGIGFADRKE
ncbi:MAG: DUF3467 domain-containing protein [Candidatus Moranbacteria bacterium]|nr:DUF3467 domain-containing protein [Candidatus Moranbacteria bacterium]